MQLPLNLENVFDIKMYQVRMSCIKYILFDTNYKKSVKRFSRYLIVLLHVHISLYLNMKETMRGRDTEYQHSYVTTKEMFFINLF